MNPWVNCKLEAHFAYMEEYLPQFLRNIGARHPPQFLRNLNPQELQNRANNLWDFAGHICNAANPWGFSK